MNWILGLVGLFFGIALGSNPWLLGAAGGFLVMFLVGSLARLNSRLDRIERELAEARMDHAQLQAREEHTRKLAESSMKRTVSAVAAAAAPEARPFVPPTPDAAPASPARVEAPAFAAAPVEKVQAAPEPAAEAAAEVRDFRAQPPQPPPLPPLQPAAPMPRPPQAPGRPDWLEGAIARVKGWFTEGNVPVKVGVMVFIVGIAAALKYALDQGYFHLPIEMRLALIAASGIGLLGFGWRQREERPAFGLSMQGGGLGVLMLTVFATYTRYHLVSPTAAFGLIVVLVVGAALLAVLQDAIALATLGFLGGYLAPVLISTGSHDHVALFTYYAALNAAVFGVSWKRSWRALNLVGFAFTFGVGTVWGVQYYRPELFATVEPFLVLFFVFYVAIGLLYVIRQTEHRRPWVDGSLVFGTPLLAFPLQAGLLKDDRMGLAFSALAVSALYAGLVWWLRRRRDERLLTEAYGALALGFATLAVPLAFHAGTTASVWALEGAGVAWLGIRQDRRFPWLAGLALQLLAAGAYTFGELDRQSLAVGKDLLVLNQAWLGAALIAVAGFVLSFVHERLRPVRGLPTLLFGWATAWWLLAGATQLGLAADMPFGAWRYAMCAYAVTILAAALLRAGIRWPRMGHLVAVCAALALPTLLGFDRRFGGPLAPDLLGVWGAYALALGWALFSTRNEESGAMKLAHLLGLWTLAVAAMLQADHLASDVWKLANGWHFATTAAPLVLATFVLWRRPAWLAWPRAERFAGYRNGWFAPAALLLGFGFLAGLASEGGTAPLPYLPLANPLELAMVAMLALLYALCEGQLVVLRRFWPYVGFVMLTSATLRAVHHWHGDPWDARIFDNGVSQMALTVVWSLVGVGAWIAGSRKANRHLWRSGALLMVVVLAKMLLVDRTYMGNISGITSFLVVGALMMGVGFIAPSPPKDDDVNPDPRKAETT